MDKVQNNESSNTRPHKKTLITLCYGVDCRAKEEEGLKPKYRKEVNRNISSAHSLTAPMIMRRLIYICV
jgi:hypothetical protein